MEKTTQMDSLLPFIDILFATISSDISVGSFVNLTLLNIK